MVAPRSPQQIGRRPRVGGDAGQLTAHLRFVRLDRHRKLIRRRHPVREHVMHFVDDGNSVVRQTFCDVHLPQGVVPVQRRTRDLADQLVEFTTATRRGDPRPSNVIVHVDLGVLDPHRVVELPGDVDELIAQRGQCVQARQGGPAEQVEVVTFDVRYIEHADLEGVHVDLGRLAVQHHRVHAVQSPHPPPPRPSSTQAVCVVPIPLVYANPGRRSAELTRAVSRISIQAVRRAEPRP
jgi:hypothetical protein